MDRAAFYAALRSRACTIFGTSLSQGQVNTLEAILNECERRGLPLAHTSYIMAVPYHEVGSSLQPREESLYYKTAARIREVWPTRFKTDAAAAPYVRQPQKLANFVYGGRMGNTAPNDGWDYRGRGLPQATGKDNYAKASKVVGIDLVKAPEKMLDLKVAVTVMVDGMVYGTFPGKKLWDYTDYRAMRAIINDDVAANGERVAGYARQFEAALKAAGYTDTKVQPAAPKPLTAQQQILLDPAAGDLVSRYPAPPMGLTEWQKVVFAVQSRLTELKYPLGGLDGKEGTLTAEALRAAQADNGIPTTGRVDLATVQAILSWPERQLVPERETATLARVEAIVPEAATVAKTRWWSKAGTWIGVGVPAVGGVGQVIEATGQAKVIMDTISAYLPSTSAIVVSLVFLAILVVVWRSSNKASAEMTDAVRTAARR